MTEAKSIPELSPLQRRSLRAAAHHLNPVVSISQKGLSDTVVKEIDLCLRAHELIKVRLYGIEREQRAELETELCAMLGCSPVQQIGNLMVLWREHTEDEKSALAARHTAKPKKPLNKKQAAAASETAAKRRVVRRPAARSRSSS